MYYLLIACIPFIFVYAHHFSCKNEGFPLILSIQNNMLISRLYPVYTPEMLRNSFFVCLLCTRLCARKKRHLNDVSIFLCYAIHLSFFVLFSLYMSNFNSCFTLIVSAFVILFVVSYTLL